VFNVVCPHVITLGFRCLFQAESVGEALSIVLERFPKLPMVIFYDVAFKIDKNAMRRVRPIMRKHAVKCILDRPHSITHTCSPVYMPDESLGKTAGVATQAAEVSHSISVANRTGLTYMRPSTYIIHRIIQVAFMNVRKLCRMYSDKGARENDHVPLAPFFHDRLAGVCQVGPTCRCSPTIQAGGEVVIDKRGSQDPSPAGGDCGVVLAAASDKHGQALGSPLRSEAPSAAGGAPPTATEQPIDAADGGIDSEGMPMEERHGAGDREAAELGGPVFATCRAGRVAAAMGVSARSLGSLGQGEDGVRGAFDPMSVRPLTQQESDFVAALTDKNLGGEAIRRRNKARIYLSVADFKRLCGESWLNDEIKNSFATLVNHKAATVAATPTGGSFPRPLRVVMHNTYFFQRLASARCGGYDYDGVRAWSAKLKLDMSSIDSILVPVNLHNTHWVLVHLDVRGRSILFFDPFGGPDGGGVVNTLRRWLKDELLHQLGDDAVQEWDVDSWTLLDTQDLPMQHDTGSCGVFVLTVAYRLSCCASLCFSQKDIAVLRKRLAILLCWDDLDFGLLDDDCLSLGGVL